MVAWAVCWVYCLEMEGVSMLRTKMDLLEAYARRSPFESELRGVGRPRSVLGEAAQIASGRGCPSVGDVVAGWEVFYLM